MDTTATNVEEKEDEIADDNTEVQLGPSGSGINDCESQPGPSGTSINDCGPQPLPSGVKDGKSKILIKF